MSLVLEVCQYLRSLPELSAVKVGNLRQSGWATAVVVNQSGGFRVNAAVDSKSIDVKVYAPDALAADNLADLVVDLLDGMTTDAIHDCWPVTLPAETVDPDGSPIRFMRFRILEG